MAAFGPVLGFLLGAYLLSYHMDSFSGSVINIGELRNCILKLENNENRFRCDGQAVGGHVVGRLPALRSPPNHRCHSVLLVSQGE